jgi:hypothetical protein
MQGQRCRLEVNPGCGDLQLALPPREAVRESQAGGAILLRQATRHLPAVAAAAGVAAAAEAVVRGAEAAAVVEAEAREVAVEGARQ